MGSDDGQLLHVAAHTAISHGVRLALAAGVSMPVAPCIMLLCRPAWMVVPNDCSLAAGLQY